MELALDEVNAKGGLFGQKVEIVYGDSECKPDKGLAAVKKLVTRDKVLVVGGGYCSSVNIAASEFCHYEKTPDVVAIAISPHHHQPRLRLRVPHQPQQPPCSLMRHQQVAGRT